MIQNADSTRVAPQDLVQHTARAATRRTYPSSGWSSWAWCAASHMCAAAGGGGTYTTPVRVWLPKKQVQLGSPCSRCQMACQGSGDGRAHCRDTCHGGRVRVVRGATAGSALRKAELPRDHICSSTGPPLRPARKFSISALRTPLLCHTLDGCFRLFVLHSRLVFKQLG
jgi:hypothetical protein